MMPERFRPFLVLLSLIVIGAVLSNGGCMAKYPNRNPVGETFPTATGENLDKEKVELPKAYLGKPALYMAGYSQNSQFDLDRWTIGLTQVEFPAAIIEVPTIPGMFPSMIKGVIDNGMRSGIPSEDWAAVITLYGNQAKPVAKFTGTENPRNGRLLLLDNEGVVRWFWDEGFSAKRLMELKKMAIDLDK